MNDKTSPHPEEADVHLTVQISNARFDFTACVTAALLFVQDCHYRRYPRHVAVISDDTRDYPRLPNERLYLNP
ncbi:hypothetical protein AB0B25_28245 [Nocardia sp. NPDC049190]|uniref:hypothetical protein n=1 Tax=Nocardia sp. NPDC049190 TaxID=3155650 RepID=UPI0033D1D2F6